MIDIIKKLTPERALEVVVRLCEKEGAVRDAVIAEAKSMLREFDTDGVADDVYVALDSIDVHDCWDRAGSSRVGYTSPEDAAVELIDEELQPFIDKTKGYSELGMTVEETMHCKGVILGIYRFQHESKSEFLDWAVDIPIECVRALLADWRDHYQDSIDAAVMDDFIKSCCPNWAKYLFPAIGPT